MVVEVSARKTYPLKDLWTVTFYKDRTAVSTWNLLEASLRKQGFASEIRETGDYLTSSCKGDSIYSVIQRLKAAGLVPGNVASVALDQDSYNPISATFTVDWTVA